MEGQNMMNQMMERMIDQFLSSMTPREKKELMKQMMPKLMEKAMEGLTTEDRQELMRSLAPTVMSEMFGCEGDMPSMKMRNMTDAEKEGKNPCVPAMDTQEGFKPWEFCPCRKLCQKALKEDT